VARVVERRTNGFWWGDLRERGDNLEDYGVDGRTILKMILKKKDEGRGLD